MEWRDQGVVLSVRPHGESSAIIEAFTAGHGRHAGVVRGGMSRRLAAVVQPGAQLELVWRARLDDHIGTYTVEPMWARAGILADRRALAGLNAVCALLRLALPERDPHPDLWHATVDLLDRLDSGADWPVAYVQWELGLLEALGFGLDLSECAVTGAQSGLVYVSPRTGRAVSAVGAGQWADRLLPLPPCLTGGMDAGPAGIAAGLAVTGHFLLRELGGGRDDAAGARLPEARSRLVAVLGKPD